MHYDEFIDDQNRSVANDLAVVARADPGQLFVSALRPSGAEPPGVPSYHPGRPADLCIVTPTFNEAENLAELVRRIDLALAGEAWELIVVDDDSPDGTAEAADRLHAVDPRVRVLRRVGRRGLSSACIEGMLASSAPYLAVIDADLQHDPRLLRSMLQRLRQGDADMVVGSRYTAGGDLGTWSSWRARLSRGATQVAQRLAGVEIADPMSGFFALRRDVLTTRVRRLSGVGFKILLDLLLTAPRDLRVVELPYRFGERVRGESKLCGAVVWEFGLLLLDKLVGRWLPARFVAFGLVGLLGLAVHFLVLSQLYLRTGVSFIAAQAFATVTAIGVNFAVNNLLTYADRPLRGLRWWRGLAGFALICGVGAAANIGVASWLFTRHAQWPVAALIGIAASAVWNYAVSARYTWRS
jgi:dolichol-phosphate mannosyltransferase